MSAQRVEIAEPVVMWRMRFGVLEAETYRALADAAQAEELNDGDWSLTGVEVCNAEPRQILTAQEFLRWRFSNDWDAPPSKARGAPVYARVKVLVPTKLSDGETWAHADDAWSEEGLVETVAAWNARVGSERVRIERVVAKSKGRR